VWGRRTAYDILGQTLDSHLGATADAMTEIVRRLGVQTDKTIGALARWEDGKMGR